MEPNQITVAKTIFGDVIVQQVDQNTHEVHLGMAMLGIVVERDETHWVYMPSLKDDNRAFEVRPMRGRILSEAVGLVVRRTFRTVEHQLKEQLA